METNSGKTLSGEDAPLFSQLRDWLDQHPGWEVVDSDDDSDQDDEHEGNGTSAIKHEP